VVDWMTVQEAGPVVVVVVAVVVVVGGGGLGAHELARRRTKKSTSKGPPGWLGSWGGRIGGEQQEARERGWKWTRGECTVTRGVDQGRGRRIIGMPLPAALLCSPLSGLGGLPGGRFDDTETRRDETRRAKIGVSSAGPVLGSFKSGLGLGQRKRPRYVLYIV
jgi:hypothetical protein